MSSMQVDFPHSATELADAALTRSTELGCAHAEFRAMRTRSGSVEVRNAALAATTDQAETGLSVRVLRDGAWGFAAASDMTPESAARAAEQAARTAELARALDLEPVVLPDEPVHRDVHWKSSYRISPFDVPTADQASLLAGWADRLLASKPVQHVHAVVSSVQENTFLATSAGTTIAQERVRVHPLVFASAVHPRTGEPTTARSLGPPVGRGWEYLLGEGWDWDAEFAALPGLLDETVHAPPVVAGEYDLVIAPSNMWLTLHETVGHATELDRVLGHESGFAGRTFVRADDVGRLRYGSPAMNVVADRTTEHGLATAGHDDEGVPVGRWPLITDGVLTGFQSDRGSAARLPDSRSRGCAFADSARHVPLSRMPNISLQPAPDGPSTEELIGSVSRGLLAVGSNSWSIDMQRQDFQFSAQRFHEIRGGRITGQVRNAAYRGTTLEFWNSLRAVGGRETFEVYGADLCGKGQPVQAAAVSHGAPATLFTGVSVLNTLGGRS